MANKKPIINHEELLSVVKEIEEFIETFKPSQLEYDLILEMLRRKLNARKIKQKKEGLIKSIVPQVKSMFGF